MKGILTTAVLLLVVVLMIWGGLHLFITRVNPEQKPPDRHFRESCWACHIVSSSAAIVED